MSNYTDKVKQLFREKFGREVAISAPDGSTVVKKYIDKYIESFLFEQIETLEKIYEEAIPKERPYSNINKDMVTEKDGEVWCDYCGEPLLHCSCLEYNQAIKDFHEAVKEAKGEV